MLNCSTFTLCRVCILLPATTVKRFESPGTKACPLVNSYQEWHSKKLESSAMRTSNLTTIIMSFEMYTVGMYCHKKLMKTWLFHFLRKWNILNILFMSSHDWSCRHSAVWCCWAWTSYRMSCRCIQRCHCSHLEGR